MGADFTRTFEGCQNIRKEEQSLGTCFRCGAPGRFHGYVVGEKRFLPYVPAWCPERKGNNDDRIATERMVAV